jgi:WD40 repeat protein
MIALGTLDGTVHILDFLGNQVRPHSRPLSLALSRLFINSQIFAFQVKEFAAHTAAVNDLSFDIEGEYIGSCSDDGTVVINSLFTDEKVLKFEYHRPMKAIALDPEYSRKMSKRFVAGGLAGQLYFNSKKWLGYRDQVCTRMGMV